MCTALTHMEDKKCLPLHCSSRLPKQAQSSPDQSSYNVVPSVGGERYTYKQSEYKSHTCNEGLRQFPIVCSSCESQPGPGPLPGARMWALSVFCGPRSPSLGQSSCRCFLPEGGWVCPGAGFSAAFRCSGRWQPCTCWECRPGAGHAAAVAAC